MAYSTMTEALDALNALTSTGTTLQADLLKLASNLSVHAEGAVTVLYSGNVGSKYSGEIIDEMLASGKDIRVIKRTFAYDFMESVAFRTKVADAFGVTFDELNSRAPSATVANNWLNHSTDGPWADASRRFAAASSDDIRIIAPEGDPTRILAQTELPVRTKGEPKENQRGQHRVSF